MVLQIKALPSGAILVHDNDGGPEVLAEVRWNMFRVRLVRAQYAGRGWQYAYVLDSPGPESDLFLRCGPIRDTVEQSCEDACALLESISVEAREAATLLSAESRPRKVD